MIMNSENGDGDESRVGSGAASASNNTLEVST